MLHIFSSIIGVKLEILSRTYISSGENWKVVYPNFEKNEFIANIYSNDYSSSFYERKPHKNILITILFMVHLSRNFKNLELDGRISIIVPVLMGVSGQNFVYKWIFNY